MSKRSGTYAFSLAAALVSIYLVAVAAWLILTKRITSPGLRRILKARFRRPYARTLETFWRQDGHCWVAPMPAFLLSDLESASCLVILEDGRPLGPGHCVHSEIRELGGGRYSHWGEWLCFSTSDNSDPSTNGRAYTVRETRD